MNNATDPPRDSCTSTSRPSDSMRWSSSTTLIGGSRASKSRRTLESVSRNDWESPNSSTENQVVDTAQVGEQLRQLVHREIFRIDRNNLPALLGLDVERTEVVVQGLRPELCFSRDERFVLPRNQMDDIALKLQAQASDHPVDLHAFAIEHDVTVHSLNNLIEARANRDWPRVIIDVDQHSYLCSHAFTDNIKRKVADVVTAPGTGARDLTSAVGHGVPSAVLVALATEATSGKGGEVRFAGDHVVFIPSCSSCVEDKERHQHQQEEQQAQETFLHLIESQLWCPLHLYAAGIIETQDPTLKSDLEAAATTHFTQTVIPHVLTTATTQNLLHSPRRQNIHAQLTQAQSTILTFSHLQTTIASLGTTLSLPPPTAALVLATKTALLTTTAQNVQSLTRGLDILQNLIWILLATSGPGLFMSSVKYTSRMIRFYDEVGEDSEVAGMLNLWWDKVRDGMGDGEDLRQMRELARDAVEAWREEMYG
ncbi:hypothetical protein M409DRAFT_53049 [Zasmidium cellare ATCC 36951]|uniref:Uncharacterized protein n=1 Tax=Zasmidium cellare ATCC 36951 TaxID=1080233 RepID=A0A6A6CQ57_ZASCE|nr:uncharacterized protein M409DRAFT_53049 [Zasmidium cellare ATCC 36951]KAF2168358.1 hypothetical protein M409DRAFT_53049 [Zasmidium cellare ATCC 36951]